MQQTKLKKITLKQHQIDFRTISPPPPKVSKNYQEWKIIIDNIICFISQSEFNAIKKAFLLSKDWTPYKGNYQQDKKYPLNILFSKFPLISKQPYQQRNYSKDQKKDELDIEIYQPYSYEKQQMENAIKIFNHMTKSEKQQACDYLSCEHNYEPALKQIQDKYIHNEEKQFMIIDYSMREQCNGCVKEIELSHYAHPNEIRISNSWEMVYIS